jgi:hypothetical protein
MEAASIIPTTIVALPTNLLQQSGKVDNHLARGYLCNMVLLVYRVFRNTVDSFHGAEQTDKRPRPRPN